MTFTFRPAIRESVPLLIGLAGGTGSGKSFSALRLAKGIAADKRFCMIDTEAGRGKHYADQFAFDHGDLGPPFTPERYTEAIIAADKAGYPAIIVDSMSHVWAGDGGVLDWQEEELDRMAGDNWSKREACKMAAWIKPKGAHKQMVAKLLQIRAHLILCFRAEPKVEMKRDENGKMKVVEKTGLIGLDGWFPICEKNLPFELTLSILLKAERPGFCVPIKLQEQHRAMVPLNKPIDESTGAALAAWSAGAKTAAPVTPKRTTPSSLVPPDDTVVIPQDEYPATPDEAVPPKVPTIPTMTIPTSEAEALYGAANKIGCLAEMSNWLKSIGVGRFRDIPCDRVDEAWELLKGIETR